MHWIRDDKREAIYHRDGDRCVYCGEGRASCMLTLDHLEPRDHGGSNDAQNLVTACVGCNSARRLLSLDEWARALCTLHGVSDGRRRVAAAVRRAASVAIDRIEGKRRVAARKAPAAGRSAA